jgi:hypothetical protein
MRVELNLLSAMWSTYLHVRTECDNPATEVDCAFGSMSRVMNAGTYYLWVDFEGWWDDPGPYTLRYSFRTNPCDPDPCPGTPECVAAGDWSGYECVCPQGMLPWGDDCVDDPCDPNPCTAVPHKNRCVVDLPGAYTCECNIGYIDDPDNPGQCIEDPDASEWAFLVYLNADNNLDPAGHDDVAEMGVAGSNAYVHIVALFDTAGYSDDGHARKIYVTQGGYDVIEDMGEIDMGDWQTLRDFGIWAVQNYPARHYALIMWDHGDGWTRKGKPDNPLFKGFSHDDTGGHISVSNGEYAQALAGITAALGDKLDIVGHDECLMGMWEVAAATAPYARYLLASEEVEPFDGWPYDDFLPDLIADHTMSPLELGTAIVDAYHAAGQWDNATLSVVDLDTLDDLNATITAFADAMMAHPELYTDIEIVSSNTQGFYDSDFRDLKDFALGVAAISGAPQDLVDAADALVQQLDISIAYSRAQAGYPGAYGMSVYLPSYSVSSQYTDAGAVWSQQTTWDEFLFDIN